MSKIIAKCAKRKRTMKTGCSEEILCETINPNDLMSHLPENVLVHHILALALPNDYSRLHLVSQKFHQLLTSNARSLPKQNIESLHFEHDWKEKCDYAECGGRASAMREGRTSSKWETDCRNLDGKQNAKGPSLAVLMRHQKVVHSVEFNQGFELKNSLDQLILLAKNEQLCLKRIDITCYMDGVTEAKLTEFLSHCSSLLEGFSVDKYTDIRDNVITDALLKPIINNGHLNSLCFWCPVGITDKTLDSFPLDKGFTLHLDNQEITARGVYRFIQRFRNSPLNLNYASLAVCTFLEKPLRNLITPDKSRVESEWGMMETKKWKIFKVPGDASSSKLEIEFHFS